MARPSKQRATTVYLAKGQAAALKRKAKASGRPMAELMREGIGLALTGSLGGLPGGAMAMVPPAEPSITTPVAVDPREMAAVTAKPQTGEVGVSGTPIWSGQIWAEANSKLRDENGYGSPGSQEWGEWEKLERTDHAVASALGLISAPLRDSTLEVEPAPETDTNSVGQPPAPALPADGLGEAPEEGEEPAETKQSDEEIAKSLGARSFRRIGGALYLDGVPVDLPPAPEDEQGAAGTEDDPAAVLQAMAGPTQNEVIASFVKDCLQKWMAPGWSMLAEQIARYGLGYGFFLGEEIWATRPDSRVPGGVAWYVKRIAQRLPSSIQSNGWREENGELATILQSGVRDGKWYYNLELPASKCLLATWNRTGNNYRGFPAFRPVWYIGKQRGDLLRILGIGSAREALGILSVEVDKEVSLSDQQRDDLQDFVENAHAHEHLAIQMPPGASLKWVTSASANKGNVLELWKALGLAIYETVQAQQTTLGTGETGSRSVGEVHDASKNAFVGGVVAWLAAVLNGIGDQAGTGLVKKLVDANFGPQAEYPKAVIHLNKPEISLADFAAAVKTLSDAGAITVGIDDENDIRERLGWAPVDPAERAAEKARKASIAAAISGNPNAKPPPDSPPPGGGPAGKAPPAVSPPDPEAAQRAAAQMSEQPAPFFPRRALRPAEQNCNLAEISDFFDTGRERFEATLKPIVEEMVRGSVGQVREAMKDGDPTELKSLKLKSALLAKAVEVYAENARAFGYRQARLELEKQGVKTLASGEMPRELAEAVSRLLLAPWDPLTGDIESSLVWKKRGEGVIDIKLKPARLTDEAVANLVGAQTKMVTEKISARLKQQVWDQAVDAVRKGKSADEAVQLVLDGLEESKALRGDAELILSRSFGMGREQFFQENADAIEALEYSAVLDRSTCDPCDAADGTRFAVNSPEHLAHLTPFAKCDGRQRCRCVLLPVAARVAA